jgi:hypothetical protein
MYISHYFSAVKRLSFHITENLMLRRRTSGGGGGGGYANQKRSRSLLKSSPGKEISISPERKSADSFRSKWDTEGTWQQDVSYISFLIDSN